MRGLFANLWRHDDVLTGRVAAAVMADRHTRLERGILELGLPPAAFRPRPFAGSEPARGREGAGGAELAAPGHGPPPLGWALKKSQMTAVASKSRQTRPTSISGRYWAPPGHVCPPPSSRTRITSLPSRPPA